MSSTAENLVPGTTLLHFRLVSRLGDLVRSTVWQAEDTRNGKQVAVKVLARQLPKDDAKREALLRDIRQGAALHHAALANVTEIVQAGDNLLMVMELVSGETISQKVKAELPDKQTYFRIAYQIADGLKFLHGKNIVHGNLGGDTVMITPAGQVKIVGINTMNLLPRREGQSSYQQRAGDARSVAYMAPEQITGKDPISGATDLYSFGVVLYEMGTGRLPYQGGPVSELARKIVEEQPQSPKAVNPGIDNAMLGLMGRCLFKDPSKRYKDAKLMLEDIGKVEPDAARFVADVTRSSLAQAGPPKAGEGARNSILLLADVADYNEMAATDPEGAGRAVSRMQQILGEAAFLYDGQVVDPFGPLVVAELPSIEAALDAGRKGEFDFSPAMQDGDPLAVRLLLHAGEVSTVDGSVVGAAVTRGSEALSHLEPMKLFLSEEFAKRARSGGLRLKEAGARGGMKLYTLMADDADAPSPAAASATAASAAVGHAAPAAAAGTAALVETQPAGDSESPVVRKKSSRNLFLVLAALAVVAILALVFMLLRPKPEVVVPVAAGPAPLAPASVATPRRISLQAFAVEGADPVLAERANQIRMASIEILRTFPELRIAEEVTPEVSPFSALLKIGATGPEMTPTMSGTKPASGSSVLVADVGSGVQAMLQWIGTQLKVPVRSSTPEALNAFSDAVTFQSSDPKKTDAALKTALKSDPRFLPAQLLAMHFYNSQHDDKSSTAAARQVMAIEPDNIEALREVARADIRTADLAGAFATYNSILKISPSDPEVLNTLARYALASGDSARLTAVLARLQRIPATEIAVHEPDVLVAAGKIESAIDQYYDIEVKVPNNPALALKIGRVSVLRHSMPIAELELKKLEKEDPLYGYHILKAYAAAQAGQRSEAQNELKLAEPNAAAVSDYWTSVADIHAMTADKTVLDALENAANHKEPTASYVLSNPLFGYLQSDARFQKVRAQLLAQQQEIRAALASVSL